MTTWFRQLDALLRGHTTAPDRLRDGEIELPLRTFIPLAILLGALYGFFMGWFAVLRGQEGGYTQWLASILKFPALFLLTLVVTFPSLYVFNTLMGGRLRFIAALRLLVGAIVVNLAVAASFGPILGFFTFSTTSYPFMVLLNVILLAIAGMVALGFLLRILRMLVYLPSARPIPPQSPQDEPSPELPDSTDFLDHDLHPAMGIFRVWLLIYGLVGAQMGWLLRPFIGSPNLPFTWFRQREGNFFLSVAAHLRELIGGG